GFYILYRFVFSLYGTAVDNLSALDSISSSWELTKGRWWLVFRANFLISIVVFVPVISIVLLIDPTAKSPQSQIASSLLGFLAAPLIGVYVVLLYRRLRDSVASTASLND
ncbi:MAG: glycerophosphoryl diester phosphodiesterase membrane domain-containing protein, partial [Microcoleus sp.]